MSTSIDLQLSLYDASGDEIDTIDLTASCESYTPAESGRTWGPPELCYPDEPESMDGFSVETRDGRSIDLAAVFGAKVEKRVEEMVLDAARAGVSAAREEAAVEAHLARSEDR